MLRLMASMPKSNHRSLAQLLKYKYRIDVCFNPASGNDILLEEVQSLVANGIL